MSIKDIAARASEIERGKCRLLILQALAEDPNYTISHDVLIELLGIYDFAASSSVRGDLVWLETKALITTKHDVSMMPESTITRMGEDVVHGRIAIAGIYRSRPGE